MFCLKLTVLEDFETEVVFHPVIMKEDWPYADTRVVLGKTVTVVSALEISVILMAKVPALEFKPMNLFSIISTPMECLDGDDDAIKAFIDLFSSLADLTWDGSASGTVH
jgi:hypothetical protein